MNESQFFEALGRKQAVIEAQDAAYSALLAVLAGVAGGGVAPARVTVDLAARTWAVAAEDVTTSDPTEPVE